MKQIFDWLREQIKDRTIRHGCPSISCWMKTSKNCDKCDLKSLQVREIFEVINEAEAKWEAEVCEWKQYLKPYGIRYQNCRAKESPVDIFAFKFCPYCGKPIKISEVE